MIDDAPLGSISRQALLAGDSPWSIQTLLAAMLLASLLVGNLLSLQVFVVVAVAVVSLWTWDVVDFGSERLNPYPLFVTVGAAAWGSYRWGFDGFAVATVGAVAVTLVWAIAVSGERELDRLAVTAMASLLTALAVGPLVLLRLRWDVEVNGYLAVVVVALAASMAALWVQDRLPLLDPNIAALGGAALGGLVAGSVSGLSLSVTFVAAVSAAGGLVAGRTAGSLLRTGQVRLLERAPGALTMLDGPLLAAGIYWLAVITLSG